MEQLIGNALVAIEERVAELQSVSDYPTQEAILSMSAGTGKNSICHSFLSASVTEKPDTREDR